MKKSLLLSSVILEQGSNKELDPDVDITLNIQALGSEFEKTLSQKVKSNNSKEVSETDTVSVFIEGVNYLIFFSSILPVINRIVNYMTGKFLRKKLNVSKNSSGDDGSFWDKLIRLSEKVNRTLDKPFKFIVSKVIRDGKTQDTVVTLLKVATFSLISIGLVNSLSVSNLSDDAVNKVVGKFGSDLSTDITQNFAKGILAKNAAQIGFSLKKGLSFLK